MAEDGAPSDAEARAGAEVEAWTHEELETNARGDIRGRQEVARARDAEQRAAGLIAQVQSCCVQLSILHATPLSMSKQ